MPSAPLNLGQLYDDHAQAIFGFLLNLTRSEADTHDLLQELFVKLATRPDLLEGVIDDRGFLLRSAHHAAVDLLRRQEARRRRHESVSADAMVLHEPAAHPDEQIFRDSLAVALGELPFEQRAVIHLKLWEGLTFETIATTLGLSPNTAASRYRYGLDKLRERLRPLYEEIR